MITLGETHRVPKSICPSCGQRLDACEMFMGNDGPSPGDVSICLTCGHLMMFAEDLSMREPTDAEIVELAGHPVMLQAQKLLGEFKALKKRQRRASKKRRR